MEENETEGPAPGRESMIAMLKRGPGEGSMLEVHSNLLFWIEDLEHRVRQLEGAPQVEWIGDVIISPESPPTGA
jgi:hypothetical protein